MPSSTVYRLLTGLLFTFYSCFSFAQTGTITLNGVSNMTLCAGNVVDVSFSTSGPAFPANTIFEVWASDAAGSFANPGKIGSGLNSPISVTLASGSNALPYGTNYRLKLLAPGTESGTSNALSIGNLISAALVDRRGNIRDASYTTICAGSRVTLTTQPYAWNQNVTSGETYQWTMNSVPLTGVSSQTLSAQQDGTYRATVRQAGCVAQSNNYELYTSTSIAPVVQSPVAGLSPSPDSPPQCDDHPVTLSSNYLGETATYQWHRDGVDVSGANSLTLSTNQTGSYTFRLTDGNCTTTTAPAPLTFGRSLYAQLSRYPAADSVFCAGSSSYTNLFIDQVTYQQIAAGIYSVQWYRDNKPLSGNNTSQQSYSVTQPGTYTVELKQGSCTTRSHAIVFSEGMAVTPLIAYYYSSKIACPGETRSLSTELVSGNYSYQWQKDGADILGATSNTYAAQQSGGYTVRLTRGTCQATSLPLSLTFSNAIQPSISFPYHPSAESCQGGIGLDVNDFAYLPNTKLQWLQDNVPIAGATTSHLLVTKSGVYSIRVTNGACTGLSKGLYARVGQTAKPRILQNRTVACANNTVLLRAYYYSGTVQWKRNGVVLPGATSIYHYATQSGWYSATVQDYSCTSESDAAEVRIGEPTSALIAGNALISAGQTAQLPISFGGPAPWSFTLTNGQSVQNTYQNPCLLPVQPTTTTTYALATVSNACGSGTTTGNATVTIGSGSADVSLNMVVSNRIPKVNDVIDYTLVLTNAGPQPADGVRVQSRLPAGISFVEALSPGVSVADGVVSADAGTIPVNSTVSLRFRARVTQSGNFATAAQVTQCQTPDPDSQPNSGTGDGQDDTATVDLRTADASGQRTASVNPDQVALPRVSGNQPGADAATADLSLTMDVSTLTPMPNDILTVTLRVSNRGGSAASAVVVQTMLPDGWALTSPASFILNGQTVSGYINQLPAGQSATLTLPIRVGSTSGQLSAQLFDMAQADPDSTPGNGYATGEDDEATVSIRLR